METTRDTPSRLAMPRSRGAGSGLLIMLLGAWGALIPLIGPYFDWVVGSDDAWNFTTGRFWLSILPGAVVFAGGLLLMMSANRATGGLGAWLAIAGGAWFVVGPVLSPIWNDTWVGEAMGGTTQQALEMVTYFYGLGALIVALASFALGRVATRSVRDMERLTAEHETVREPSGRFRRDRDAETTDTTAPAPEQQPPATRTSGPTAT